MTSIINDPLPEEWNERHGGNESEAEPRVEDVRQPGQDHQSNGEEEADHHTSKCSITRAHYFQSYKNIETLLSLFSLKERVHKRLLEKSKDRKKK